MVFLPRGVAHSFTVDSEHVRNLALSTAAELEGFFRECSVPAPSMTLPSAYGIEFVLPKR